MQTIITIVVLVVMFLVSAIRILREYERGVIFRLGRVLPAKGPGLIILIPIIDKMERVSLRLVAMDVPPQDVITRDNVSVKVNAVIYFRVMDPVKSVVEVANYYAATYQIALTSMRNIIGQSYSAFDFRKVMDEGKILLINLCNTNFLLIIIICGKKSSTYSNAHKHLKISAFRPVLKYQLHTTFFIWTKGKRCRCVCIVTTNKSKISNYWMLNNYWTPIMRSNTSGIPL